MKKYILMFLFIGFVWGQTDLDKLVLKDGTTYFGEYSKTERKIAYFKPQDAFGFQPIPIKRIKQLQLKDGQIIVLDGKVISLTLEEYQKLSTKEKAIYDANLYDLEHWALYGPISTIIFWGCTHLYLEDGEEWWNRLHDKKFLRGSSAASLTIPYFVLNWKEKFTYPKSLTDDDRLYYKIAYSIRLTGRKIKWIVGSTILAGTAYLIYVMVMSGISGSIDMGPGPPGPY